MIMPSVAKVKFIKTKASFRYLPKRSETKFHHMRITKSKVIFVQIPIPKWEKTKKLGKIFWITKQTNEGITNRGRC